METGQQLILFFLGAGVGLAAGVVIGIILQRRQYAQEQEKPQAQVAGQEYATVDPESIHTLSDEADEPGTDQVLCPVCGHSNPPGHRFCFDCGGRLW